MMVNRVARRLLIVVSVLTFLTGVAFWALCNVGRWLVLDDALLPAQAIVVLSGGIHFRAVEVA